MFYISEEELRFKKDTNPNYSNEKLCHVFMTELFNLKNLYPFHNFIEIAKNAMQYYLNRSYLDEVIVFFEDCSILKVNFTKDGFEWSEHYDEDITTAFYYGRYTFRV
ncbi:MULTISPECIES: hypothetical protein [Neisseria]|jgi:hypothetical protein|uniref:hypothetical protein n=1 Tax=Neisseria TaxID=482 RepID=UPI0009BBE8DD|nr:MULTISPECIES: hypothetical protein [Neisseria]